ncbi:hypothetical protein SNE40_011361 [Patella caerulea]|uniref:Chitin-binding type-2 domain-containing protein n=1 Tax=Patella caerulea TaxID=87958 RepID=A0AAN8PXQ1_PATCE
MLRFKVVILFLFYVGICASNTDSERAPMLKPLSNPCKGTLTLHWIREPNTCNRYIVCAAGQPIRMPACPDTHIWSQRGRNCVPKGSRWDDCSFSQIAATIVTRKAVHEKRFTNSLLSDEVQITSSTSTDKMAARIKKGSSLFQRITLIKRTFPNHPCAFSTTELILPHAENCHWYYNCSLSVDLAEWKYNEPMTSECPYPKLFSLSSRRCEDYSEVECGYRKLSKNPCLYRENICRTSHCRPCTLRYGNCEGMEDGYHPFPSKEWTPNYIICKDERSSQQLQCRDPRPIFSPETKKCEHLKNVPKSYGGLRPVCDGRRDGFYPDESGRCDVYFECFQSQFTEYSKCTGETVYSAGQGRCTFGDVEPPCGNITNNICTDLADGYYSDPYGRCPLYFHCKTRRLLGYLKCPFGSYNPYTERCEVTPNSPQPCGDLPNPCMSRSDGVYADIANNCLSSFTCKQRFVIKIQSCKTGFVFNEQTRRCEDVNDTPAPCGLAPSCQGKPNGRYPAPLKGCEHYFVCQQEHFIGYEKCSYDKGGFYFNPTTQECDFPLNICGNCGTRVSNW